VLSDKAYATDDAADAVADVFPPVASAAAADECQTCQWAFVDDISSSCRVCEVLILCGFHSLLPRHVADSVSRFQCGTVFAICIVVASFSLCVWECVQREKTSL